MSHCNQNIKYLKKVNWLAQKNISPCLAKFSSWKNLLFLIANKLAGIGEFLNL